MTADPLLIIFLPAALGIIMLGLGLSLSLADFARVVQFPKPVLVGLVCQILLLPVVCFFIAKGFGLAPALAVGLMLLAASPGGTSANLYSHLAHGDVALNITLTAVNSVIAILTMPIIVNLSLNHFMAADQTLPLQFGKVLQVFAIVLGPVAIGMLIKRQMPGFAARMDKPVKILSGLFLLRYEGLTFLMLTVAVGQIAQNGASKLRDWTGGEDGLTGFEVQKILGVWSFDLYGKVAFVYCFVVLLVCLWCMRRLMGSPFGLSVVGIHQNRLRTAAIGGSVRGQLLKLYTIAGAFAGISGALAAQAAGAVRPHAG